MFASLTRCLFFLYTGSLTSAVAAKNFTVPSTWQTTSNLSRESRETIVFNAATTLSQGLDPLSGQTTELYPQMLGSFFAVLVLEDYYSGNTSWQSEGTDVLKRYIHKFGLYDTEAPNTPAYSDAIYWGLTSFYSYRTYNDSTLLDLAKEAYNVTYPGFITPSAAANGSGAGRTVSLTPPTNCTGGTKTFAGGIFDYPDSPNDDEISIWTVGPFMTLSAYLFEETKDPFYKQGAQLSLEFIINYMLNGTVVTDSFHPTTCTTLYKPLAVNQAWFIEGLSAWANITQDSTLVSLLEDVIANITAAPDWISSSHGILSPSSTSRDNPGILVRGLTEASMRNPDTELSRYIQSFINVQFNALSQHVPGPNTSFYSQSWLTPDSSTFDATGSIYAMDVLNAAFRFAPMTPETGPEPASKSTNIGTITGAVVGSVIAIVAVIAGVLLRRRRRQQSRAHASNHEGGDLSVVDGTIDPFLSPRSTVERAGTAKSRAEGLESAATSQPISTPEPVLGSSAHQLDEMREQEAPEDALDTAELPTLVRRLNNLLSRGRQVEPPPEYEN